jgi:hypothetical protein
MTMPDLRNPRHDGRAIGFWPALYLAAEILWRLVRFESHLRKNDFTTLYETVRQYPLRRDAPPSQTVEIICAQFDRTCIWYWKPVLCLQRSAVLSCALRRHGIPAQMVIGAHNFPFKAHAWVEVGGNVVGDKPYMREIYSVLDVC